MKKIITLSLIFLITCSFLNISFLKAGDRKVFIERFTSSTCGPCASNNPYLESFLSTADPNKVVNLSYHMNWPAPGNDPMYLANPNDNTARRTNYGVNAIPDWFFDGTISMFGGTTAAVQAAFDSRVDILSPVTIVLTETRVGNNVTARAEIYCEAALSSPNATVHFAVYENFIQYPSPPGTNGERNFHTVMRKMLPSGTGIPVVLLPGRKITFDYAYTIDPSWQADQVTNLVFVQGFASEILNCATVTTDFNLISWPNYNVANQGQAQSADYKVKIPVVASGYNSAGITASSYYQFQR